MPHLSATPAADRGHLPPPHRWLVIPLLLAARMSLGAEHPPTIRLTPIATELGTITTITHANDDRLFISSLDGRIWIWRDGAVLPTPFLDLRDRVLSGQVQGLLGLAFHPAYPQRNAFFVHYIDAEERGVIARFSAEADSDQADPASERILLAIPHQRGGHNGGQLQFGPDGHLYIASGDDGGIRDPDCNAQDPTTWLGKLLRLDVDSHADEPPYYAIPGDNPFGPADPFRDEIWALGLRNPWRFSFDRATGDRFLADVGQDAFEEINWQPANAGGGTNYGWKALEGTLCTNDTSGCGFPVEPCDSPAYRPPVLELAHADGDCSVTGGYVYRGRQLPELLGSYVFGDFCSGKLRAARTVPRDWSTRELGVVLPGLTTFGEDLAGELWLGAEGTLYRLDPTVDTTCAADEERLCLLDRRFAVSMTWQTPAGQSGVGHAVPLSADSGTFWFFSPANTEVLVKLHDACVAPYHHVWVFAAGLTNVAVTWSVEDTATGMRRTYTNPVGTPFAPLQDTRAFASCP